MPSSNKIKTKALTEKYWFQSTFGKRLFAIFSGLSILPIIAISFIGYTNTTKSIEAQLFNNLVSTARSREIAIVAYLDGKLGRALDFSTDGLINFTMNELSNNSPDRDDIIKRLNDHLKYKKLLDPEIYEIFLINAEGIITASSNEISLGNNKVSDPYFTEAREGGYIKDFYLSKTTGKKGFSVSAPIFDKISGTFLGVIVNRYPIDGLNKITHERDGLGETGEVYIVNKNKKMITESRFQENASLRLEVDTEPVILFLNTKKEMRGKYKDYRGELIVGASEGDDLTEKFGLEWVILAEIDDNEVFAPIHRMKKILIITDIFLILLILTATIIITRRTIGPIRELISHALEVADGNLDTTIHITSKDEIADLASSFQKMTADLKEMLHKEEKQSWLKGGQAELGNKMRGEQGQIELCRNVIHFLSTYLNAQIGAIYLVNEEEKLELAASFAWHNPKKFPIKLVMGEGLVGEVARKKEKIHLTDLPEEYFKIKSSIGGATPKNVVLIPLIMDDKVKGVVEIGSFDTFQDKQVEFLESVSENIAIAIQVAQGRL